jgi:hypothetical protein
VIDKLTHTDMVSLMEQLATAFGGKRDLEAKVELYFDRLQHVPLSAVRAAVDRVLDEEHKYLPLVGTIKRYAKEHLRALRAKDPAPPPDPTLRCPDCLERIAWHRVISGHTGTGQPILTVKSIIRHTDSCADQRRQTRVFEMYAWQWADPIVAGVPEMDLAWHHLDDPEWQGDGRPGQDWTEPIGPMPPRLDQLPDIAPRPRPRTPNPYPQVPPPAVHVAALLPAVRQTLERGDAYEEPEKSE